MAPKRWRLKAGETPTCVPVVSFSHGSLSASTRLPVSVYEKNVTTAGRTKTRRILVSEADGLEYVGENYGEHGLRANTHCNHFVAVENVSTGRVALYPADLITMRPYFAKTISDASKAQDKSYREQVDALATTFGSKRKRRAVETRLRLQVDESTLRETAASTLDAVKDTLATARNDTPAGKTPASVAEAIPPQNRDATIPQDVYQIEDIIPPEHNDYLDELAEPLLNATPDQIAQWRSDATYPEYVINRLERLSRDPENRAIELRLLVFYCMLISVSRLKYNDVKKKDPLPDISEPLKSIILDTFTITSRTERGATSRNFPQRMKDKVLAYIMVIVLVLEDYKYDFKTVQLDTKSSDRTLTTLAYALGCHVGTRKTPGVRIGSKYLELKLPLVDPSQHIRAKKARVA
ncbi:RNA polymerase I subunit E [Amblyomma americanum]|uniref:DNA-directed RNA polymerase I subunit RPA49 n=1 Tax=Amblyomma americanum TaxID=6943 RepID=A0AAQ4D2Y4_AMBAM